MKTVALLGLIGATALVAQLDWQGVALVVGAIGTAAVVIIRAIGDVKKELLAVRTKVEEVEKKNVEIEIRTNGMGTKLNEVTKIAALYEGKEIGRAEQKAEGKTDAKEVREQIAEAAGTLSSVKETGEDTNKVVNEMNGGATPEVIK